MPAFIQHEKVVHIIYMLLLLCYSLAQVESFEYVFNDLNVVATFDSKHNAQYGVYVADVV